MALTFSRKSPTYTIDISKLKNASVDTNSGRDNLTPILCPGCGAIVVHETCDYCGRPRTDK